MKQRLNQDQIRSRAKQIQIGIDPGVRTGFAAWDRKNRSFISVLTFSGMVQAMQHVTEWHKLNPGQVFVTIEDARLRRWFGKDASLKVQGAGSIKRECKEWETEMKRQGVDFEMTAPKKGLTKFDADKFRKLTGWQGRTSSHARDAANLVWGR